MTVAIASHGKRPSSVSLLEMSDCGERDATGLDPVRRAVAGPIEKVSGLTGCTGGIRLPPAAGPCSQTPLAWGVIGVIIEI